MRLCPRSINYGMECFCRKRHLIHDPVLLDLLSDFSTEKFDGVVFRATRKSADPLAPSTNGGRWMPREYRAVLYTSLTRDGALAERAFHEGKLTPLPSKPTVVHRLSVGAHKTLRLLSTDLISLGIELANYAEINYLKTQEIGAAAAFLGCDGLIAPSARWACDNLVLFTDNFQTLDSIELQDSEEVDWQIWARENGVLE